MPSKKTTRKRSPAAEAAPVADPLQTKAQMIVRLYGITFGMCNGRRCIYADNVPQRDLDIVAQAMREGKI